MTRPSLDRALLSLLFLASTAVVGCMHQHPAAGDDEAALPEPEALAAQDPDPEADQGQPQFCNVTGKQGAELQKCVEHNEAYYHQFAEEAKQREPWFNFTPDSWLTSTELEPRYVLRVVKQDEAVRKLEATPLVELSKDEVGYFTGKAPTYPGLRPYLVRGLTEGQGDFSVFEKGQAIFVRHDSLGAPAPSEQRTALVVFLAFKPQEVYIDCQAGE